MADTLIAPPDKPVILPQAGVQQDPPPDDSQKAPPDKAGGSFLKGVAKLNQAAAKAPDGTAATEDDGPAGLSDKGKVDWKAVNAAKRAAEAKAAEFEAKYTTETGTLKEQLAAKEAEIAKARSEFDPVEVARLKEEHAALKQELNLADVTKSPEWKQAFVVPVQNATKAALALVDDTSKQIAEWYLSQPDSPQRTDALEGLMAGMSPLKVGKFTNALQVIDSTRERANSVLADQAGLVQKYQAGRETEEKMRTQQQQMAEKKAFDTVSAKVVAYKMPWDADPANYDKAAQEGIAKAQQYYGATDPETRARVAHWAAFGEVALPQTKALQDKVNELNATIAKLTAAQTKAPGGSGSGGGAVTAPKGGEFLAKVRGG